MTDYIRFRNYLIRSVSPSIVILIIVIAITIFLSGTTKLSYNKLVEAHNKQIQSYQWTAKIDSIDGIILGGSTLRYGLSSNLLKSNEYKQWVNFSMDAQDPIVNYILLKEYCNQINPKIVLVGLDPWIYSKKYYQYRNQILLNDLNPIQILNFMFSIDPFLPVKIIKTQFKNSEPNKSNILIIPPDFGSVKLNRTAVNFNEVNEDWFEINKFGWSNIQFEYLLKIKDLCHEKGFLLVFVVPPKRKDFVEVSLSKFELENKIWWEKICAILPNENIVGTYDALSQQNQESIFAEAYHLNYKGQEVFSSYLKTAINKPNKIAKEYNFIISSKSNQNHQGSN